MSLALSQRCDNISQCRETNRTVFNENDIALNNSEQISGVETSLTVDICILQIPLSRFGEKLSLFKRASLQIVVENTKVREIIEENFGKKYIVIKEETTSSSGLKGWQIALIVIGSVLGVGLIAGFIIIMIKKKNRDQKAFTVQRNKLIIVPAQRTTSVQDIVTSPQEAEENRYENVMKD
ncbi:DgyrCDS12794 [Dimorphilus gyrociliatus]|uniref:DgyrCDS12794 n=1 Tax=Dimorphilus gyrociliatus TaxID=2664684 RepID=A0A7I8W8Q9_9ANNE|nr:DgyrCDS12794 [Dimorphilus gyrociliatus]